MAVLLVMWMNVTDGVRLVVNLFRKVKKMKIKIEDKAPDWFTKGDCENCPFESCCEYEEECQVEIAKKHDGCVGCKSENTNEKCTICKNNYVDQYEKRAMKVTTIREIANNFEVFDCPKCGAIGRYDEYGCRRIKFCSSCGQELDWGDEDVEQD